MDILKIRKKKRDEADADAPSSSSSTAPATKSEPASTSAAQPSAAEPAPRSSQPPPQKRSKAAPPAKETASDEKTADAAAARPARPVPPPAASTPSAPPATVRAVASTTPVSPTSAAPLRARGSDAAAASYVDDPLLEFLARYDEGAEESTVGISPDAHRDETKRYLAFELAGEEYAASIMEIREILRVLALTAVPRAPREILGVISKRGLVMPVIDLAATLGLREPDETWNPRQRILVVGEADRVCGLRVDRVLEVVRLRADDVEEVPASLGARSKHQLRGLGRVNERMFILLDVGAVLHAMAVAAGLESREEVA